MEANHEEAGFSGGQDGKTEKDGITVLNMALGDNNDPAAIKGEKAAIKMGEDEWKTAEELAAERRGRRVRGFIRWIAGLKAPAAQAQEILTN